MTHNERGREGAYRCSGGILRGLRCLFLTGVMLLLGLLASLGLWPGISSAEISARAAVVIDGNTGRILFAKNPHLKLPPASTTKLMTAMVALDRMSPESVVTISEHAAETQSVSPRIRVGERYRVRDLLHLSLMRSVNGAAVALAEGAAGSEEAFVRLMNERAQQSGAENTRFINASGLPGEGQSITAFELAGIMNEALSYPLIREIINTKTADVRALGGRRLSVKNTNHLLWSDDDLVGGKTGYTRAARHCFVCAAEKGETMLIVALLGESVRDDLWQETSLLLAKGRDVLAQRADPVIYFSSSRERPVVLASYTPGNGKSGKDARVSKGGAAKSQTAQGKGKKGAGKVKTAKKKSKATKVASGSGGVKRS